MLDFLKKPVITLDGFKITVLVVILIALAFMVYRQARR